MENSKIVYPEPKRDEQYKDQHGLQDPYIWLEDDNSKETAEWVNSENKITQDFLQKCSVREKIGEKLTNIYNYEKYSCPYKRGSNYYFSKNNGLQNQDVIYTQKTLTAEAEVFLDPNKLTEDGTACIATQAFSDTAKYYVYGVQYSGSDWITGFVKDVASKQDLPDKLNFVKFSGFTWTKDDVGFFYNRYIIDESKSLEEQKTLANDNQKVFYHKVGTPQSDDILIFDFPEQPKWMFDADVSNDGKWLLMSIYQGCAHEHKLYFADLSNFHQNPKGLQFIKFIDNFDSKYNYISNIGSVFYFVNNLKAPKNQIVALDFTKSATDLKIIVPENKTDPLDSARCVNHKFMLIVYNHDVCDVLQLHNLEDGKFIKNIELPPLPTLAISVKHDQDEFFFKYISFLSPGTIYHFSFQTQESKVFKEIILPGFDPLQFEAKQVFYESKDKTKIPMFMIQKKGSQQNGQQPFFLYGYGGFNISIQPSFNALRIVLLNNLGVNLAYANIRGGNEYGEEWHQQGIKDRKQNVFDDFQAAAEYLINQKYTNPKKLCICGGSNGGLLVAACINQRPELYQTAICAVGVLDMLKFHKFTIGHAWVTDYGCADNQEDFKYLIKYCPLHNVKKQKYPALLLTTADHDDRVSPLHSFKFAATIQHTAGKESFQENPLLIRIDVKAGHGGGKPTTKIIEEQKDVYSFIYLTLQLDFKE